MASLAGLCTRPAPRSRHRDGYTATRQEGGGEGRGVRGDGVGKGLEGAAGGHEGEVESGGRKIGERAERRGRIGGEDRAEEEEGQPGRRCKVTASSPASTQRRESSGRHRPLRRRRRVWGDFESLRHVPMPFQVSQFREKRMCVCLDLFVVYVPVPGGPPRPVHVSQSFTPGWPTPTPCPPPPAPPQHLTHAHSPSPTLSVPADSTPNTFTANIS